MIPQLLLIAALCIAQSFSTDTAYRLNTPIKPSSYAIVITPYFDTGDSKAFTFDGEVTIKFQTNSMTSAIKLHSQDLDYSEANITVLSGSQNLPLSTTNPLQFDKNYTFAFINLVSELQIGTEYSLNIVYRGPIRKDLQGFYQNYYMEKGVKKWLGATQMEPTHARKVFPCFDEPELKATFTLTVDRPANFQPSLANTKMQSSVALSNGYVREVFYPTPIMSTYLVAFLISEFEAEHYSAVDSREFGVFTRPEAKNQTDYSFEFGKKVEEALSAYFGIDFYTVNQYLKLDHVALPDFRAGAMENWGLVKYRESLLLYVPEESTPYFKYRVAQIMAHETTHMWFGNLVTCHWWSNTWLNEGFANYFQDYITSLIEPDVGAGDILVTGSVYSAYEADWSPDSPPITNINVNSPAEISAHFGTITYQKAGSVIRMMHHLIGDDAFILGLNLYLNGNKFSSGYPDLMYEALNEGATISQSLAKYPGATVAAVMGSWIAQAGHPVVFVQVNYGTNATVFLSQKRFYKDSSHESDELYQIPISYTTGISPNFNDTKPAFIMTGESYNFTIPNLNHSWVIFNLQETGLYRVNYDDHSWEMIIEVLKGNERESIHHLNRAKIINDVFALYYANQVSFSRVLDVLEILEEETNYSVWYAAIHGLNKLRSMYLGTDALDNIDTYIMKLTNKLIVKLGYIVDSSEGTVELRNRMQILDIACRVGHTGCVDFIVNTFKNFKTSGTPIPPSLRPAAYCNGLHYGDEEDYEFLWSRMVTTNVASEARTIGDALGCTRNEAKVKKYLVSMLEENSPIRTQDLTVPLASVLSTYENVPLVLKELEENYDQWTNIYTSMDSVLSTIASALHTEAEFKEFESWLASCTKCTSEAVKAATTAVTEARTTAAWANAHKAEILKQLNFATISAPSCILLAIGLITFVFNFRG